MRQSGKDESAQGARRGRAGAAGEDALAQASTAFASLLLRWPEIAGAEVARVAQPVRLQEGPEGAILTLRCAPGSAVLLQHETRTLIERVNAYLGHRRVARLRVVTGAALLTPAPTRHPSSGRPQEGDFEEPEDLAHALARLGGRRRDSRPR